ncbi:hypothetical protein [Flavobacterium phage FL-1]|nr:hypothetical protein [Flavobacterium phage FL-1]
MSQLKKLQSWLAAFQRANSGFPDEKAIKFKIKELLKEEVVEVKSKSKQIFFRECKWSDYQTLRNELGKSQKFIRDYAGVDLKAYIESALAWSEKGNKSTEMGWMLTLKNWMRRAKDEKRLIMKPKASVKDAFNNQ